MKIVQLSERNAETLQKFLDGVKEGETRPALYIGFDKDRVPILHIAPMSAQEMAHIKLAFDMQVTSQWLGLSDDGAG